MEHDYKLGLTDLRQRVSVGIKQALQLLHETHGDVGKAEALLKARCVEIVQARTGASADLSEQCLAATGFDIPLAMERVEAATYSLTERIFRKQPRKEEALDVLAAAIEIAHGLEGQFWFSPAALQPLNEQQFCFMLIHEWISYEDWETFYWSLDFEIAAVSTQIRQNFQLPELADVLLQANHRQQSIRNAVVDSSHSDISNTVAKDAAMMEYQEYYARHRSTLLDALHAYVSQHISCFP